ncbi:MAG: MFS transporter [Nevskia sp.]|nr:MFS transporter [Nevskia sp.]
MLSSATVAARIDRLPPSRTVRRLVLLLSLGGWFEFYDLFFTAYIGPGLTHGGLFSPPGAGPFEVGSLASFVASLFTGLFVGTIAFSWLSDRFGRRAVFTFSLLWYSIGSAIMAFQHTALAIDLWRLVASIGIGVELVNIDTYISEIVPRTQRGPAFAFNQCVMFSVVPVVALLAWLLVPTAPLGLDGWRWVVLIGSAGAIPVWWIRKRLPESPRWLAQHGQLAQAGRIVLDLERQVQAETGQALPAPRPVEGEAEQRSGAWSEMWSRAYRGRTVMLMVYNLFQTIGYYGFASWVPQFLISQGITVTRSLEWTFIIAIANPVGPLVAIGLADRFERKWQIVGSALAVAVFGLAFAGQRGAVGVIVFGILITLANNWMSFSFHAYQAELYPTRIRAKAVGFVYSWSRFSAIFSGFIIAWCLKTYGAIGVFTFIAAAMLVVAVVIGGFGTSTTRRRLEEIAA